MTLFTSIYKKIVSQSSESLHKYSSPPPETIEVVKKKRKRRKFPFSHVKPRVDCSPPYWVPSPLTNSLARWERHLWENMMNNIQLVVAIRKTCLDGGKVDCRRHRPILYSRAYTQNRVNAYRKIQRENKIIYNVLKNTRCKVVSTACLERQWEENKRLVVDTATTRFVLFPTSPREEVEDSSLLAAAGVKRPRVYLTLRARGGAVLGSLAVELFCDVCPRTCSLFQDLLEGDGLGYGYVGTQFSRKVPQLFWSGGDVVSDTGFGCYAQRGRRAPLGAENYHLSHSMPGLVSMRVTADDEMCGIFTITFKPLPQLDLRNVVFGRVVRPSRTFDAMKSLGSALSSHPQVEICASRRRAGRVWVQGRPNAKLPNISTCY